MLYPHLQDLESLVAQRLVNKRKHPLYPIWIYNYSVTATFKPVSEWTAALEDARGLILDEHGAIIGRPFRKFWNYEQVLDKIPNEGFTVWEKMDGSLGVVCNYQGNMIVATRGSFESEQAIWAARWLREEHQDFLPEQGLTFLLEIVYPANRIVVGYGERAELVLLAVMNSDGKDQDDLFIQDANFTKARRFDGVSDFAEIESIQGNHVGEEGFVVRWDGGMRAKLKFEEYKRIHRLITQCSTRTIWELLRAGKSTQELIERVPDEFSIWVRTQISDLGLNQDGLVGWAHTTMATAPKTDSRKEFAEWAKAQKHPSLLFSLVDGKPIDDACWKMVEPKWSTPFRPEAE